MIILWSDYKKFREAIKILKYSMTIRFLKLSLASPEAIKSWTERKLPNGNKVGKILKGDLIDYKNGLPIRDGLSCERIFGPMVSFTCSCGRFKCIETRGIHIVHDTLRTSRPVVSPVTLNTNKFYTETENQRSLDFLAENEGGGLGQKNTNQVVTNINNYSQNKFINLESTFAKNSSIFYTLPFVTPKHFLKKNKENKNLIAVSRLLKKIPFRSLPYMANTNLLDFNRFIIKMFFKKKDTIVFFPLRNQEKRLFSYLYEFVKNNDQKLAKINKNIPIFRKGFLGFNRILQINPKIVFYNNTNNQNYKKRNILFLSKQFTISSTRFLPSNFLGILTKNGGTEYVFNKQNRAWKNKLSAIENLNISNFEVWKHSPWKKKSWKSQNIHTFSNSKNRILTNQSLNIAKQWSVNTKLESNSLLKTEPKLRTSAISDSTVEKPLSKIQNVASPLRPGKVYKFKTFPPEEIRYCPHCEVELLPNSIRRYRLGYIEFVSPVAHIWYSSNSIPLLLNLSKTLVEGIASCHEALSSGFPPISKWSYNGSEPTSWTFQMQPLKLPIHFSMSLSYIEHFSKNNSPENFPIELFKKSNMYRSFITSYSSYPYKWKKKSLQSLFISMWQPRSQNIFNRWAAYNFNYDCLQSNLNFYGASVYGQLPVNLKNQNHSFIFSKRQFINSWKYRNYQKIFNRNVHSLWTKYIITSNLLFNKNWNFINFRPFSYAKLKPTSRKLSKLKPYCLNMQIISNYPKQPQTCKFLYNNSYFKETQEKSIRFCKSPSYTPFFEPYSMHFNNNFSSTNSKFPKNQQTKVDFNNTIFDRPQLSEKTNNLNSGNNDNGNIFVKSIISLKPQINFELKKNHALVSEKEKNVYFAFQKKPNLSNESYFLGYCLDGAQSKYKFKNINKSPQRNFKKFSLNHFFYFASPEIYSHGYYSFLNKYSLHETENQISSSFDFNKKSKYQKYLDLLAFFSMPKREEYMFKNPTVFRKSFFTNQINRSWKDKTTPQKSTDDTIFGKQNIGSSQITDVNEDNMGYSAKSYDSWLNEIFTATDYEKKQTWLKLEGFYETNDQKPNESDPESWSGPLVLPFLGKNPDNLEIKSSYYSKSESFSIDKLMVDLFSSPNFEINSTDNLNISNETENQTSSASSFQPYLNLNQTANPYGRIFSDQIYLPYSQYSRDIQFKNFTLDLLRSASLRVSSKKNIYPSAVSKSLLQNRNLFRNFKLSSKADVSICKDKSKHLENSRNLSFFGFPANIDKLYDSNGKNQLDESYYESYSSNVETRKNLFYDQTPYTNFFGIDIWKNETVFQNFPKALFSNQNKYISISAASQFKKFSDSLSGTFFSNLAYKFSLENQFQLDVKKTFFDKPTFIEEQRLFFPITTKNEILLKLYNSTNVSHIHQKFSKSHFVPFLENRPLKISRFKTNPKDLLQGKSYINDIDIYKYVPKLFIPVFIKNEEEEYSFLNTEGSDLEDNIFGKKDDISRKNESVTGSDKDFSTILSNLFIDLPLSAYYLESNFYYTSIEQMARSEVCSGSAGFLKNLFYRNKLVQTSSLISHLQTPRFTNFTKLSFNLHYNPHYIWPGTMQKTMKIKYPQATALKNTKVKQNVMNFYDISNSYQEWKKKIPVKLNKYNKSSTSISVIYRFTISKFSNTKNLNTITPCVETKLLQTSLGNERILMNSTPNITQNQVQTNTLFKSCKKPIITNTKKCWFLFNNLNNLSFFDKKTIKNNSTIFPQSYQAKQNNNNKAVAYNLKIRCSSPKNIFVYNQYAAKCKFTEKSISVNRILYKKSMMTFRFCRFKSSNINFNFCFIFPEKLLNHLEKSTMQWSTPFIELLECKNNHRKKGNVLLSEKNRFNFHCAPALLCFAPQKYRQKSLVSLFFNKSSLNDQFDSITDYYSIISSVWSSFLSKIQNAKKTAAIIQKDNKWDNVQKLTTVIELFGSLNIYAKRNFLNIWHVCYKTKNKRLKSLVPLYSSIPKKKKQSFTYNYTKWEEDKSKLLNRNLKNPTRLTVLKQKNSEINNIKRCFLQISSASLGEQKNEKFANTQKLKISSEFFQLKKKESLYKSYLCFFYTMKRLEICWEAAYETKHSDESIKNIFFIYAAPRISSFSTLSSSYLCGKPWKLNIFNDSNIENIENTEHLNKDMLVHEDLILSSQRSLNLFDFTNNSSELTYQFTENYVSSRIKRGLSNVNFATAYFSLSLDIPKQKRESNRHVTLENKKTKQPLQNSKEYANKIPILEGAINTNYYGCISQLTTWGSDHGSFLLFLKYIRANIYKGDFLLPPYFNKTNFQMIPRTGSIMLEQLLKELSLGKESKNILNDINFSTETGIKSPNQNMRGSHNNFYKQPFDSKYQISESSFKNEIIYHEWNLLPNITKNIIPQRELKDWFETVARQRIILRPFIFLQALHSNSTFNKKNLFTQVYVVPRKKQIESKPIFQYSQFYNWGTGVYKIKNPVVYLNFKNKNINSPEGLLKGSNFLAFAWYRLNHFFEYIAEPITLKTRMQFVKGGFYFQSIHDHSILKLIYYLYLSLQINLLPDRKQVQHYHSMIVKSNYIHQISLDTSLLSKRYCFQNKNIQLYNSLWFHSSPVSSTSYSGLLKQKAEFFIRRIKNSRKGNVFDISFSAEETRLVPNLVSSRCFDLSRQIKTLTGYQIKKNKKQPKAKKIFFNSSEKKIQLSNTYYHLYDRMNTQEPLFKKEKQLYNNRKSANLNTINYLKKFNKNLKHNFYFSNEKTKIYNIFISPFEQNQSSLKAINDLMVLFDVAPSYILSSRPPPDKSNFHNKQYQPWSETMQKTIKIKSFFYTYSTNKSFIHPHNFKNFDHNHYLSTVLPNTYQEPVIGEKLFRKLKIIGNSIHLMKKKDTLFKTILLKMNSVLNPLIGNKNALPYCSYPTFAAWNLVFSNPKSHLIQSVHTDFNWSKTYEAPKFNDLFIANTHVLPLKIKTQFLNILKTASNPSPWLDLYHNLNLVSIKENFHGENFTVNTNFLTYWRFLLTLNNSLPELTSGKSLSKILAKKSCFAQEKYLGFSAFDMRYSPIKTSLDNYWLLNNSKYDLTNILEFYKARNKFLLKKLFKQQIRFISSSPIISTKSTLRQSQNFKNLVCTTLWNNVIPFIFSHWFKSHNISFFYSKFELNAKNFREETNSPGTWFRLLTQDNNSNYGIVAQNSQSQSDFVNSTPYKSSHLLPLKNTFSFSARFMRYITNYNRQNIDQLSNILTNNSHYPFRNGINKKKNQFNLDNSSWKLPISKTNMYQFAYNSINKSLVPYKEENILPPVSKPYLSLLRKANILEDLKRPNPINFNLKSTYLSILSGGFPSPITEIFFPKNSAWLSFSAKYVSLSRQTNIFANLLDSYKNPTNSAENQMSSTSSFQIKPNLHANKKINPRPIFFSPFFLSKSRKYQKELVYYPYKKNIPSLAVLQKNILATNSWKDKVKWSLQSNRTSSILFKKFLNPEKVEKHFLRQRTFLDINRSLPSLEKTNSYQHDSALLSNTPNYKTTQLPLAKNNSDFYVSEESGAKKKKLKHHLSFKLNSNLSMVFPYYTRNLRKLRLHYLRNFRRLRFIEYLKATSIKPEWMILYLLPVLPPDLRPVIANPRGYITGDINTHYQNVIYRNNNIEKLLDTFWIPKKFYRQPRINAPLLNPNLVGTNNHGYYSFLTAASKVFNGRSEIVNRTSNSTIVLQNFTRPSIRDSQKIFSSSTQNLNTLLNPNNKQFFSNFSPERSYIPNLNETNLSSLKDSMSEIIENNMQSSSSLKQPLKYSFYNWFEMKYGESSFRNNQKYWPLIPLPSIKLKKIRSQVLHDSKPLQEMQYSLQKAVDALIDNSQKFPSNVLLRKGRPLKSLSDNLKGKEGRFRQHLLGKRVDYSGRSVIIVGPNLKLYECGIPLIMALRLFQPFLILYLIYRFKISSLLATQLIQRKHPMIIHLLKKFIETWPILLNRAPTLHRMNIQAFKIRLVQGKSILLHPLVCSSYNADFDGDQMGVHVPITQQARAESWKLLWTINNSMSIASRQPLFLPSQDMVIGNYYLTQNPLLLTEQKASPHYEFEENTERLSVVQNFSPAKSMVIDKNNSLGGHYFFSIQDAYLYYLNNIYHFHVNTPIWFHSQMVFETTEREKPIEIILDSYGTSTYIAKYYEKQLKRNRILASSQFPLNSNNKTNILLPPNLLNRINNPIVLNQIIRSTFGRIEFYYEAYSSFYK